MRVISEVGESISRLKRKLINWEKVPLDVRIGEGESHQATIRFTNYKQEEIEQFFITYINPSVKNAFLGVQLSGINKDVLKKIYYKDILYFEALGDRLYAYTQSDAYLIKHKLYEIEDVHSSFIRINKSMVVNILAVDKISPSLNSKLTLWLTDGQDLEVSRKYRKEFLKYLEET